MASKYLPQMALKIKRTAAGSLAQVMWAIMRTCVPKDEDDTHCLMIWAANMSIVSELQSKLLATTDVQKHLKIKLDAVQMLAFREMWSTEILPPYEDNIMRDLIQQVDKGIFGLKFGTIK